MSGDARLYIDYLAHEGYRPTTDADGDVEFHYEGGYYYIDIETSDANYFQLVYPSFWRIESDEEFARAIRTVAAGQFYFCPESSSALASSVGVANESLPKKVLEMGGREQDIFWAMMATHGVYSDPKLLRDYVPYVKHIHGKFYEMLPEGREYSIPYDEIIPVLIEGGYDGYLSSEYEGNRHIQDAFPVDSVEQVRRQHAMFRHLLGEA